MYQQNGILTEGIADQPDIFCCVHNGSYEERLIRQSSAQADLSVLDPLLLVESSCHSFNILIIKPYLFLHFVCDICTV